MKLPSGELSFTDDKDYPAVQVTPTKSPHNDTPIGRFQVEYLKKWVAFMEHADQEEVYVWELSHDRDSVPLIATTSKDSPKVGIGVAPMIMKGEDNAHL